MHTTHALTWCARQRSEASPACDPLALERLDKFLEHRLKGINHIRDIVQQDYEDAQVMLGHLTPLGR